MKNNLSIEFWIVLLGLDFSVSISLLLSDVLQILSNISIMEDPFIGLILDSTSNILYEKKLIQVDWDRERAELSYTVELEGEFRQWSHPIPRDVEEILNLDFWRQLNIIFSDAIPQANPSEEEWTNISFTLQNIGRMLFEKLVPSEVAAQITNWEPGLSVRFSTTEEWIPWELMHDGHNFLGDKFILVRYPRMKRGTRYRVRSTNTQQDLKRIRKIVNVVGGNIRPTTYANRAYNLFHYLPDSIVKSIREESKSILGAALAEADILHFTCHGHFRPFHLLQIFSGSLPVDNLCIHDVRGLALKPGSFVFANACASNAPVQAFSEFTSFGLEFYLQGADIFIGTLGIIPTEYAITFAEDVYRELLLQENGRITVGQAIANAKQRARDSRNNFFWLLYCMYGNPDCYFEPAQSTVVN